MFNIQQISIQVDEYFISGQYISDYNGNKTATTTTYILENWMSTTTTETLFGTYLHIECIMEEVSETGIPI